ncbi:MAG: hypothetical protein SGJ24_11155 [Chloroflexota bacterium]|nr:hypothetical protein [Chloroflexota bacterium]
MTRSPRKSVSIETVMAYFVAYQEQHGHPPSIREVCGALAFNSTSTTKYALDALVRRGDLHHDPSAKRAYSSVTLSNPAVVPLRKPIPKPISKLDRLLHDYRQACIAAGVDPETGPETRYQAVLAIAAARKRRRIVAGTVRWWQVDWSDPGTCRSDVEYEAFFNLFCAAWRRMTRYG